MANSEHGEEIALTEYHDEDSGQVLVKGKVTQRNLIILEKISFLFFINYVFGRMNFIEFQNEKSSGHNNSNMTILCNSTLARAILPTAPVAEWQAGASEVGDPSVDEDRALVS